MLVEIHCEKFRTTPVTFTEGLNAVVGDSVATNSIGKSTFLMVIDFVMGGDTFYKHNKDVIDELGHHEYFFKFEFDGIVHSFMRGTSNSDIIFKCTEDRIVRDSISTKEYREFLSDSYGINHLGLTFRKMVSLFSRIWGKENLDPYRPLTEHKKQKASESLVFALKLFEKYYSIENLTELLKEKDLEKKAFSDAFRENLIPKISKKKYIQNQITTEKISGELDDIKNHLEKYAVNIREIVNSEVEEIKSEKDNLLQSKLLVDIRLKRVEESLRQNRNVRSKKFDVLKKFFPEVLDKKIAEVEEFHSNIAKILKNELKASEKELLVEQSRINEVLAKLDEKMKSILSESSIDNPGVIVDRVYELSSNMRTANLENKYYDQNIELNQTVKNIKNELNELKKNLLAEIENLINTTLRDLSSFIYSSSKKSPYLSFTSSNYNYEIFEDTGTGKAYSNLVLFDWAVFMTSDIPILIHDSLLFKNVENEAVANMMSVYGNFNKQVFIAIDEVQKYGEEAEEVIDQHTVLRLSDNHVLYNKDWRKK
ncbi:DUF2326 domain-containing protein [Gimesia maris]|uniref:DUF2326 domain-containing protein n=1 Tax=Gimesia maris TaxID=122 RepID=A0ABX5YH99_9PLAN|nr:DUF2326 domain-containing protein [Gimesia maris]EDL59527.1 Chromosome segregation ATPase [Gimesia maris DSM 8797]QEG15122.1 hypothetical protein GmarT_09600 [Gimesia maris]QGQ31530.1 DUF2326 domain-containing protein [Gimesia maris]